MESTGDEAIVSLDLGGRSVRAKIPGRVRVKLGQSVLVGTEPAEVHLFEAQSDERIDVR